MAKLKTLSAENIKALKSLSIDFTQHGNLVIFGGKNGAGKSSSLDTIIYLFGGKGAIPEDVLRHGADHGTIDGTLDDGTHVRRTFTKMGVHLVVENEKGMRFTSPQAVLDKLIQAANGGKSSLLFDPLAFSNMAPKEQIETLKNVLGIDTTTLDEAYKLAYEERRNNGRDLKQLEARLIAAKTYDDIPEEPISIGALMTELQEREEENREHERARVQVEALRKEVREKKRMMVLTQDAIKGVEKEVTELKKRLVSEAKALDKLVEKGKAAAKKAAGLTDVETAPIHEAIERASEVNDHIRANQAAREIEEEIAGYTNRIKENQDAMSAADAERIALIENAQFTIPGLAFTEDGVSVDGVRWENLASGDQTKISVAMALAMNPELKVLLIHGGSLLDTDHLKWIKDAAVKSDTVILMEVVGGGPEVDILLDKGHVIEKEAVDEDPE